MEIIEANESNFDELLSRGDMLVDFYATWCGPCKMLAPELEAIKDEIQIVKVDVDENRELCKRYGVMSMPTLIYFNGGNRDVRIGYMPKDEILKWIGR